jgi:very-short-patch-repair endonuclease
MKIIYNPKLTEFAKQLRNNPTKSERLLWQQLKGDKLGYDFHRQKPISYYIADFYCHQLHLVIELDGITHDDISVQIKDAKKEEYLFGKNISVLRFRDDEVFYEMDKVLETIRRYIEEFRKSG